MIKTCWLKYQARAPTPESNIIHESLYHVCIRLCTCRRISENAFGILAKRWRIFHSPLMLNPHKTTKVVLATTSLHNWLRSEAFSRDIYSPPGLVDEESTTGTVVPGSLRPDQPAATWLPFHAEGSNDHRLRAKSIREEFKQYFVNEGAVRWQRRMRNLEWSSPIYYSLCLIILNLESQCMSDNFQWNLS